MDRGTRQFRALVTVLVIAGSLMVGYAWAQRQYEYPTLFDSWQNAYAVFDCESEAWLEPFDSTNNPNGIRTRNDGIIYIEPTDESITGDNAHLHVFLDNVGASLSDDVLQLPDGSTLAEEGTFCSGEEAVLQVLRWDSPTAESPSEVRLEELADIKFLADRQALVIALAPVGSIIPLPSSVNNLAPERLAQ